MAPKIVRDFADGLSAEKKCQELFKSAKIGCELETLKENRLKWDLICHLEGARFNAEVKFDKMWSRTGNIALEYWNSKKNTPSGITATESEIWLHVINFPTMEIWASSVNGIRKYTKDVKPKRIVEKAGDDNADIMLYESSIIFPAIFERLDILSMKEIRKAIQKKIEEHNV